MVQTLENSTSKEKKKERKTGLPALLIPEIQDMYTHWVNTKLQQAPTLSTITDITDRLVTVLSEAATKTLPQGNKNNSKHDVMFKNDTELNALLDQRDQSNWPRKLSRYRKMSKLIKKHIIYLRNECLK